MGWLWVDRFSFDTVSYDNSKQGWWGGLSLPYPRLPLAFKISLRVVVMKESRQEFDSVPKWFIFKCCSQKQWNIKLEQMLLRRLKGLWSQDSQGAAMGVKVRRR